MLYSLKQTKALCKIRLLLFWNNIRSKAGIGKIIGMGFAAIIMIIATASASSDLLEGIHKLPFADLLAEWAIGFLVLYAIFIVFTGDLVSGHSLNTGQMSSDFDYLSTLPVSPKILIFTKLFERLITDYFGILFLLPSLIGVSCSKGYSVNSFLTAFLIYAEIGMIIGLLINLLLIILKRFFKASTINNFFSIFGYISALLTLIPFIILSDFNPSYIPDILVKIEQIRLYTPWLLLPIKWLATPLLLATPFCTEFAKLTALWAITATVLTTLFYKSVKNNWFNYAHSQKAATSPIFKGKFLSGLFYKEFLMLKSDFNLLVNAVLMPISIIGAEIYFLKRVFTFTSIHSVMNFIFGSIIYFSMFGPINAIGYEGKAMNILETLPISPGQLIKKKFYFWYLLALFIFIPATIITLTTLNFGTEVVLKNCLSTVFFTFASVWIALCFSTIFAKYDTKILQQHSSFLGKFAAMATISLLLPLKGISFSSLFTLLLFFTIGYLCYIKAKVHLAFRQDKESIKNSDSHQMINCFLLFLVFVAFENSIYNIFKSLAPWSDTGIWNWCLSLVIMFPFVIIYKKSSSPIFPKINFNKLGKVIFISALSLGFTLLYIKLYPEIYASMRIDTKQIIDFRYFLFMPLIIWKIFLLLLATVFMSILVRRSEEYFISDENKGIKLLGCFLVLLISLPNLMPPTSIYLITLFLFNMKKSCQGIGFYSAVIFFGSSFCYLIF